MAKRLLFASLEVQQKSNCHFKDRKITLERSGDGMWKPLIQGGSGGRCGPSAQARNLASVLCSAPPLSTQEREEHSSAAPSQVDTREKQYYDCIPSIQIGLVVLVQN